MKIKNVFLILTAAAFVFAFTVCAFAQGSVNSNNEGAPATNNGYPETSGVFDTGSVTSGLSDPATEYNESDEISGTETDRRAVTGSDTVTDRDPTHTAVDPATNTSAPNSAMVNNGGMTAVLIATVATAAALLLIFGFAANRKREM